MSHVAPHPDRDTRPAPSLRSRVAAICSLAASFVTFVALVVFTARNPAATIVALVTCSLGVTAVPIAATNAHVRRTSAAGAALFVGATIAVLVAAGDSAAQIGIVTVGLAISAELGSLALSWEIRRAVAERWHEVPAVRRGVILINPRSGDGKPARLHLADEARRRGIEPVVLDSGDDLRALAEAAVARGADALGMAGGDGSQAIVAAVAADHGVPYICIPAGTRNHLALDLGVDRHHPVRALDAFGPARETSIDLAEVNGEVFVNNVSLGIYAQFVASDEYREAKRRTVAAMLPGLLAPDAPDFGFRVADDGEPISQPRIILVSNNPYTLSSLAGFGSRARLDSGALGVATLSISRGSDVNHLAALEIAGHPDRYEGWREWTTRQLVIEGPPESRAAVDGEARTWDPPLRFAIRPKALRVRIARKQPGASPAFLRAPVATSTAVGLARVARGRPSGIVPDG